MFGEFIEQADGNFVQDRRLCDPPINTVCIVYPSGGYSFQSGDSFGAGGWVPLNFGKCRDVETAKSVADATDWRP